MLGAVTSITGNAGGPVGPSGTGTINVLGTNPITVTGNPVTNTETITVATATTAQIGATTLATNAETIAGAIGNHAVVPSSLAAKLGVQTVNSVPYGNGTGNAINWMPVGTNGQVIIGSTGGAPAFATISSLGGTIAITPGANSLNLEVAMTGMPFTREVNAAVGMANNHGYINTNVGLTTFTLPALAALGTEIIIMGESAGLWSIAQNGGQNIQFGNLSTTPGIGGSLTATNAFDTIHFVCRVANTTWSVISATGNITII